MIFLENENGLIYDKTNSGYFLNKFYLKIALAHLKIPHIFIYLFMEN